MKKQNTEVSTIRSEKFNNFFCSQHPLIQDKLSKLREKHTSHKEFTALVEEITLLLIYEASTHWPLKKVTIETPLESCESYRLISDDLILIPILRAGLGMVNSFQLLLPEIKIGHIGLRRDEKTHLPELYYCNLPAHSKNSCFIICDPMLATGNTAINAIELLKKHGAEKIIILNLVAAPEGITHFQSVHPDVPIYAAALDRELNSTAYILPGLGDAGDRLFGTIA